jgi:hemerythrin-like metal-binding protein
MPDHPAAALQQTASIMAAFFIWNDSYDTGIRIIDSQHKRLIAILNELFEAMEKGQGSAIMAKLLADLHNYTVTHFSTEENLLKQSDYPDFAAHKKLHDEFAARVHQMQAACEKGQVSMSLRLATFLKTWLAEHILGTDKQYVEHLKSKGVW